MGAPSFYVACPLGDRTGGPEALTLLVHSIRKRGYEAFLIPMYNFRGRRPHPEYDVFDYKVADSMPRSADAHLVLGEVSPIESYRELQQTPDENIWMLWLSVNYSPLPEARYYRATENSCSTLPPGRAGSEIPGELWPYDDVDITTGIARTLREAIRRRGLSVRTARSVAVETVSIAYAQRVVRRNINFGAQSFYAAGFLRSVLGRESFLLTDYPRQPRVRPEVRDRTLVLYNGAKGTGRIGDLQAALPEVNFRPIRNMAYDEVCQALSRAALYVEIGHLPGRDRLPREAANYGTPTVMLARGAGYCWDDFPLGQRYRIPYTIDWVARMAPVIREVLRDPIPIRETQASFREWVAGEKDRYEASLDAWMERVTTAG